MKEDILNAVGGDEKKYNLIMQKTRQRDVVLLRWQVFATLHAKKYTLEAIGSIFNMHHATIIHGLKKAYVSDETRALAIGDELKEIKSKIIKFR